MSQFVGVTVQNTVCMNSSTRLQHLGQRLRDARKQVGLTQQEVATDFQITRQAVSGWECGKHQPTLDQFCELGLLYVTSADWLLYGMKTVPASLRPVMKQVFGATAEDDLVSGG